MIKRTLSRYPEIVYKLNQCAISNRDGEEPFIVFPVKRGVLISQTTHEVHCVPCTTLDYCVSRHGIPHVDLLKLDIEGHELQALQGAARAIRAIFFEYTNIIERIKNPDAVLEFLDSAG
jgi:FkbM family methyltransferase